MPNTEQNVTVKLVRMSLRIPKLDWFLEPRTLAEGIHVARVLLPNEDLRTVIDSEVAKMETSGIIEPSCSPWANNVVVVTKHDGTSRITLDYRQLNNVTYKDSYPLPNIAAGLDAFKGAFYFDVLDLKSSFYQVPLAEEDRDKTAFINGSLEFTGNLSADFHTCIY